MTEQDYLGAAGGQLAIAFAAGCAATWTFLQKFFWSGIRRSLEKRISDLEKDNERCEARTNFLETLLWMHGPQEIRKAIQGSISEERSERLAQFSELQDIIKKDEAP